MRKFNDEKKYSKYFSGLLIALLKLITIIIDCKGKVIKEDYNVRRLERENNYFINIVRVTKTTNKARYKIKLFLRKFILEFLIEEISKKKSGNKCFSE